jgi:O-antigen/teichoic acid export membrane protein
MSLLLVPVSAVQFALINVLRFVERPRTFAVLAAVDLFSQLALAVLFVALGMGAFGAIAGYVLGSTLGMLAAAFAAAPFLDRRIDVSLTWRILGEGLPFVPGAAAFLAADGISRMLAANVLSVAAVGQLALAIRIASVMSLSSVAFQMAWGPYGLALKPGGATERVFGRVTLALIALISIAALGLGSVAPEITVLLGGDQFADAAEVVPGLLISAGLPAVLYVLTTAAGIVRRGPWVAWSSLLGAATQIVSIALLLPVLGLPGFAAGAILGRVTSLVVLSRGVADTARLPVTAIVILAGAIGAAIWVQTLNAEPTGNLVVRLAVAVIAAVAGAVLLWVWVRHFRADGLPALQSGSP